MSKTTLNDDLNIVANSNLEITYMDGDLNIIQALDDEPNDVGGLTSAQLKAKFDEGPNKIKTYINDTLIPEILSEEATEAARAAAEAQRETNENQRIANENARIAAEQARVSETNGVVAQAAEQAEAAAESARLAAQAMLGQIPDGSFPESKLVAELQAAIDRAKAGGEIDITLSNKLGLELIYELASHTSDFPAQTITFNGESDAYMIQFSFGHKGVASSPTAIVQSLILKAGETGFATANRGVGGSTSGLMAQTLRRFTTKKTSIAFEDAVFFNGPSKESVTSNTSLYPARIYRILGLPNA